MVYETRPSRNFAPFLRQLPKRKPKLVLSPFFTNYTRRGTDAPL
jgi:hypothetical protein